MVQSYGGIGDALNVNKLTSEVREIAQPYLAFSQASQPGPGNAIGLGEGDTGQYTTVTDVDTEGGQISENDRIPTTALTPKKVTWQLQEYGNAIEYTGKLKLLSELDTEDIHISALMNDYQKNKNTQSYDQFKLTDWHASMNTVATDREFVKNGTLTKVQNTDLDLENAGFVKTKAKDNNIPYWDGESFLGIIGPDSEESLTNDPVAATYLSRDSGAAALNGEIGRAKETRWVIDNQKLVISTGTFKEWFLIGNDSVVFEEALPVEMRAEDDDFGRHLGIAYYFIAVWFKVWDQTADTREHIIKVESA